MGNRFFSDSLPKTMFVDTHTHTHRVCVSVSRVQGPGFIFEIQVSGFKIQESEFRIQVPRGLFWGRHQPTKPCEVLP